MDPREKKRLIALLAELSGAIEELLLSGTTAASAATQEKVGVAFREASRAKLLRLGSTLRVVLEELKRLEGDAASFSPERLSFFLDRAWLLSRGIAGALERGDEAAYQRLAHAPEATPVAGVDVVTLGVFRRHVPGAFAAFDFRLRALTDAGPIRADQPLSWSCVFPMKPGQDLPPEAFLALQQKQKFRPTDLLERKSLRIEKCAIAADGSPARVLLGPESSVTRGAAFADWPRFVRFDRDGILERVRAHAPDPLALPVELSEEIVLSDWTVGDFAPIEGRAYRAAELEAAGLRFSVRADTDHAVDGIVRAGKARARPALYGTLHFELCRLVLTPLALIGPEGPTYCTVADAKIDKAALVRALNIT